MKYKAFIFDMDGVIVDTARLWHSHETAYLEDLFGVETINKIGDRVGVDIKTIFQKATKYKPNITFKKYLDGYEKLAKIIYQNSDITPNLDKLAELLLKKDFQLGLVSNAKPNWIDMVVQRLSFKDKFSNILSVYNNGRLRIKPEPDGYVECMHKLKANPKTTIILEDSNSGIEAARESGAFTVALMENKVTNYVQIGANIYVETVKDLIKLIDKFDYLPS
ncbi:HAD family phosphatase [Candidatus Dojkabacteria bacterium]|nr:HAD family phosphatase [Candidatus Dojkabacteria bacterium]